MSVIRKTLKGEVAAENSVGNPKPNFRLFLLATSPLGKKRDEKRREKKKRGERKEKKAI